MVHVDCRATSDRTAQVSSLARIGRPPTWLQAACSRHSADRTVFTSKDGLDAVTWLANKNLSNVQNPRLIRRKRQLKGLLFFYLYITYMPSVCAGWCPHNFIFTQECNLKFTHYYVLSHCSQI